MDFNDTPKEAEFREKVRTFLDQNVEKRSTNLKTVQGGKIQFYIIVIVRLLQSINS